MEQTMGKRIAAARKAKGLTQDQLAEKLGVTAQAVSKWENDLSCPDAGRESVTVVGTLPALADIFNVTVDELLGRPSADTESRDRPLVGEVIHQAEEDTDSDDGGYEGKNSLRVDIHTGRRGGLGFAAFLLAVGALALTSVILEKDWSLWSLIWPTALIMIGLTSLWNRFSFFSAGMALAGTYFLLNNIGVLHYSQSNRLILPLCILLIGLTILVDTFRKPKKRRFSVTRKDPGGKPPANTTFPPTDSPRPAVLAPIAGMSAFPCCVAETQAAPSASSPLTCPAARRWRRSACWIWIAASVS